MAMQMLGRTLGPGRAPLSAVTMQSILCFGGKHGDQSCRAASPNAAAFLEERRGSATPPYISNCMDTA